MANRKRTITSKPYIPNGGLNSDMDSLDIRDNECTDILNLRIYPNRVQTRSGSRELVEDTPSGDPILHYHSYRDADGNKILFGFTEDFVFKFNEGAGGWDDAIAAPLSSTVSFWHTTNFTDLSKGTTVVAAGTTPPNPIEAETDGGSRALLFFNRSSGLFEAVEQKSELRNVIAETLNTGDGVASTYTGTIANTLIEPGSVSITTLDTGSTLMTVTDDGAGGLIGDIAAGTNTVDYTTGAVDVTFQAAVKNLELILVAYDWFELVDQKPRFVFNFHNRVVMANEYDDDVNEYNPWRVRWSLAGNLERSDQGLAFNDLVDSDVSPIAGGNYLQRLLVLVKEESVVLMRFIGGLSVFSFNTEWHEGTFAGDTIARWQNLLFYLGKDDVYVFDGAQATRIAEHRVRDAIFDILTTDQLRHMFGRIYPRFNEYWLWITTDDNTFPTEVFVYNIKLNAWSRFKFNQTPDMGLYHTVSGQTIDDLVGTIDDQNWTLDSGILDGSAESPVIADDTGGTFVLDERVNSDYLTASTSQPIPIRFVSRDFTHVDLPRKERNNQFLFEALGGTIEVSYSRDFGVTFKREKTLTLQPQFTRSRYWIDTNADNIRFKFAGDQTDQFLALRWMQALAITREKS